MDRILVVDDEKPITRILDIFLTRNGFSVVVSNSGEEALRFLEKEKFGLLILDKKMPGMGGEELLETLKTRGIGVPPTIILTGTLVGPKHGQYSSAADSVIVFSKPLDLNILLDAIKEKLRR